MIHLNRWSITKFALRVNMIDVWLIALIGNIEGTMSHLFDVNEIQDDESQSNLLNRISGYGGIFALPLEIVLYVRQWKLDALACRNDIVNSVEELVSPSRIPIEQL